MIKNNLKKYSVFLLVIVLLSLSLIAILKIEENQGKNPLKEDLDGNLSLTPSQTWSNPQVVGSIYLGDDYNTHHGIEVAGNLAYVGTSYDGMLIFNVSDPSNPELVNSFRHDTAGNVRNVNIDGHLAYLADDDRGFEIVDISDPNNLVEIYWSGYSGFNNVYDVEVSGGYAYVADDQGGLKIYDVSNPHSVSYTGGIDYSGGWIEDVQVVGNIAYCADPGDGLEVIDVSNPASPSILDLYEEYPSTNDQCRALHVVNGIAYVAGYNGLWLINVTNPRNIYKITEIDIFTVGVYVEGNLAFCTTLEDVEIWDISDPANPSFVGIADTDHSQTVFVLGNYAYVADGGWAGEGGFKILKGFNSSKPEWRNPSQVGGIDDFSGNGWSVQVEGTIAYMAGQADGLEIFDVSDPQNPSFIADYVSGGAVRDVFVEGNIAYVADITNGMRIVNVTDPAHPTLIQTYSGTANAIFVDGRIAYIASGSSGLEIVDITDPSSPSKLGEYGDLHNDSVDVEVLGGLAYVIDDSDGLEIINVSDPTNPFEVGEFDEEFDLWRVDVVGTTAFVSNYDYGLKIVDCSNPASPVKISEYGDDANYTIGIQVVGNLAFVADRYDGIEILNITDIKNPVRIGDLDIASNEPYGVDVVGNLVYVADRQTDLRIIDGLAPNINSPADAVYGVGVAGPTINWILYDDLAGGQYQVRINDTVNISWAPWTDGQNLMVPIDTSRAAGSWNYTIEYYDSGLISGMSDMVIITLEDTPPTANNPSDASYSANISDTFDNWILTDNIAGGYYRVLRNESVHVDWAPWISGNNVSVPVNVDNGLGFWNYTIQYNDTAGIFGIPDTVFITINDNTAPTSNSPLEASYASNTTSSFDNWILSDNAAGGNYRVYLNDSLHVDWSPWTNGDNLTVPVETDRGFGIWNYTVQFYDSKGLWGTPNTVFITIYDNQNPTSNSPPNALYGQNLTEYYTQWILSDNLVGGYYQILINNTVWVNSEPWTSGINLSIPVNTTDNAGYYNYTILYNDSVGLWGTPDTVIIRIDGTIPWSSTPSGGNYSYNSPAIITWTLWDDIAGGYYRILRNGTEFKPWDLWLDNSPIIIQADTAVIDGAWNYTIEYNDSSGLSGNSHTVKFS